MTMHSVVIQPKFIVWLERRKEFNVMLLLLLTTFLFYLEKYEACITNITFVAIHLWLVKLIPDYTCPVFFSGKISSSEKYKILCKLCDLQASIVASVYMFLPLGFKKSRRKRRKKKIKGVLKLLTTTTTLLFFLFIYFRFSLFSSFCSLFLTTVTLICLWENLFKIKMREKKNRWTGGRKWLLIEREKKRSWEFFFFLWSSLIFIYSQELISFRRLRRVT